MLHGQKQNMLLSPHLHQYTPQLRTPPQIKGPPPFLFHHSLLYPPTPLRLYLFTSINGRPTSSASWITCSAFPPLSSNPVRNTSCRLTISLNAHCNSFLSTSPFTRTATGRLYKLLSSSN